ncbi:methionyl-tRNA formyltransferase [Candidatus Peregrinibacteria bacterium]|nr:methionyl-tRNA formyltransferase [Candidatus Peregrinibacteria bacterium]
MNICYSFGVKYCGVKYRIIFFGSSEFAIPSLEKLIFSEIYDVLAVVTQPDKPVGRDHVLFSTPVKKYAELHHILLLEDAPENFISHFSSWNIDLGIVIAYGAILPSKLLSIPRRGFINLHASLLPQYRGASPVQTALLHGDTETGVSIIQVNPRVDRGAIFTQKSFSIRPSDTSSSLLTALSKLGAVLLIDTLPRFFRDELIPLKQDDSIATFSRKIRRDDGLIQWNNQSAETIISMYRAYVPWPGISTFYQKKRLKITEISFTPFLFSPLQDDVSLYNFISSDDDVSSQYGFLSQPGTVFRIVEKRLPDDKNAVHNNPVVANKHIGIVTKGGQAVILKRVQLEGKKEMDIESFVRGNPQFIGQVLS